MEKIYFDNDTYIWKTKLNHTNNKLDLLKEASVVIDSQPYIKTDGFSYKIEWNENLNFIGEFKIETKLDEIVQLGVNKCIEIHKEKNTNYNKINNDNAKYKIIYKGNQTVQYNMEEVSIGGDNLKIYQILELK